MQDDSTYDVAIIGLGPAGSTVARLLDPAFRIIAIDKKSGAQAASFHKPCGGLLAPDAQKALSRFNLTLPKDILVDPQIFSVKTLDLDHDLLRYYRRFYINLDRHKFDLWLISLVPEHVTLAAGAYCKSIRQTGGVYEITFQQHAAERTITARHVIGADGSSSFVRKSLFPGRDIRRYVCVQQWFEERHPVPFYSCIFDSSLTDSYCWSISKDGYFILGGAFPEKDGRKRFERLKEKLQAHGFTLGPAVKTEGCQVSMPRRPRDFCIAEGNAFLIGEAAGLISPSSLEGISYALDSAHRLAMILNSGRKNPARALRLQLLPMRIKLLLKHLKIPFMYRPFLRKLVMKTGVGSITVMDRRETSE